MRKASLLSTCRLALGIQSYSESMSSIKSTESAECDLRVSIGVGGKKAYPFNYVQNQRGRKRYHTDLYVGDFPNGEVELWMRADSWRLKDLEVARRIFRTIKFLQP